MRRTFESLFAETGGGGFIMREDEEGLKVNQNPCSEIAFKEEIDSLHAALRKLPWKYRNIVNRSYGLSGKRESLSQIGKSYRVSKQRAGQLKNTAMLRLRKQLCNFDKIIKRQKE
jgi:DNA-directed RNA polymerase sigma subunit (sigma70/sigma32)